MYIWLNIKPGIWYSLFNISPLSSLIISLKWPMQRFCLKGASVRCHWCHWWCVVHGSQVNLVHLICVCAALALGWSLPILAGVVVYAGGASTYKLYYFACINTVALLKACCCLENPLGCCRRKNIDWLIDIHMISPSSNKICDGPNWLVGSNHLNTWFIMCSPEGTSLWRFGWGRLSVILSKCSRNFFCRRTWGRLSVMLSRK